MRIETILLFQQCVSVLKSTVLLPPSLVGRGSRQKAELAHKSISLIIGCLLEQLVWTSRSEGRAVEESRGTEAERRDLIIAAISTLSVVIIECGGVLPLASRSLIDSFIARWVEIHQQAVPTLLSHDTLKLPLLKLVTAFLSAPFLYRDFKPMLRGIRNLTLPLLQSPDVVVASAAQICLGLTDSVYCSQRLPPLAYVPPSAPVSHMDIAPIVSSLEEAQKEQESERLSVPSRKRVTRPDRVEKLEVKKRLKPVHVTKICKEDESGSTLNGTEESKPNKVRESTPQGKISMNDHPKECAEAMETVQRTSKPMTEKVQEVPTKDHSDSEDDDFNMPGIIESGPD
eukprot:CAMPEP_0202475720 /NCGR_PEP_ID=MMETSP1360-20130828/93049_1 /ASSEMBLY_ACC=CAM_ASM_000848 /TAXON_ID=515479 /ORGANISM="Licmophora paradoxa, Strain CCMP2313" /LENGTH=342 /DNA_ID=CAMNT_0049102899 /DNA_START=781 /DNA_END=1809 /DNA_ORIENTATION=-